MQLNKRLLILIGLGGAIFYIGTNYRIAGLDQLSLQPRSSDRDYSDIDSSEWGDDSHFFDPQASFSSAWPKKPASGGKSSRDGAAIFDNLPPWQPKLNAGEKLAVMEDKLAEKIQGLKPGSSLIGDAAGGDASNTAFPVQLPLPLPEELERARPGAQRSSRDPSSGRFVGRFSPEAELQDDGKGSPAFDRHHPKIRVASWNLNGFGAHQLSQPQVMDVVTAVIQPFDVVALQGVQSQRDDILPDLVDALNRSGKNFDYVIGPRVGRDQHRQQYAFVFNTKTVETDRYQLYTVEDPEDLMAFDPLVAWFRCKAVDAKQAFTFSLVNIRIHPDRAGAEQAILPNLIHAVVQDGRREDDVIALGDFVGDPSRLSSLHTDAVRFAITDLATDVTGEKAHSGIFFSSRATCEFTGRSGVIDFLRKFNLSLEKALEVSPHLPVWAEFYASEGAEPGRLAPGSPREN